MSPYLIFWCRWWDHSHSRHKNSPLDYFYLRLGWPWTSLDLARSFSSPTFLLYIKMQPEGCILLWYRWWDSNPHGFPLDFESSASANSATSAYFFAICIIQYVFLNYNCFLKKGIPFSFCSFFRFSHVSIHLFFSFGKLSIFLSKKMVNINNSTGVMQNTMFQNPYIPILFIYSATYTA